jgi:plastocyanin
LASAAAAVGILLGALPAPGADSHPGHGPVVIAIGSLAYTPAKVTVVEGDYVLWDWQGPDTNHTVTADPGQSVAFESDPGKSPEQVDHPLNDGFSVIFPRAGTYTFHCRVHAFMTGTVEVLPTPPGSAPGPQVTPVLSGVRVSPLPCRRRSCPSVRVQVRFTVNEAVSMRATVRRVRAGRAAGAPIKEVDFSGPPGTTTRRLAFGRLKAGRYQVRLVAVDQSTGTSTAPAVRSFQVRG